MKKHLSKAFLIVCLLLILLLADSKYRLTVSEYTIHSRHLPDAFNGYTIVQLSDLHGMEFGEGNHRLIKAVSKLHPDLIALTGDFIESADDLPITESLVSRLTEIAPVYFTSGNHDWASHAITSLRDTVTAQGGIYLSNECLSIEKDGSSIILAGVEDPNGRADMIRPDMLLEQISANHPEKYIVLLAHRNDFIEKYPTLPCDVIFTGHGHGGVIRLPLIGGIIGTDRNLFPKYDAGLYTANRYTMVVSRGLGDAPIIPRLLNNPEIVSVRLVQK